MITVFTDGSSRGNPGPGGWGAIVADENIVFELGGRENETTNNRMEITAVIEALHKISKENLEKEITIHTDSAYVINGITRWVKGWERNGWITSTKDPVQNKDLWLNLTKETTKKVIHWKLVKGHSGTPGNERCDVIATSYADGSPVILYTGSSQRYGVDISKIISGDEEKPKKSKSKAWSYLSMVDGEIKVHKTWDECKKRVEGVSGAKYKKSVSPEDEQNIISEFAD
ncbi:MAG: ribonuclease HI [Minisyncoccia bacterium]